MCTKYCKDSTHRKFNYVSHTAYTYSLKVILYIIFSTHYDYNLSYAVSYEVHHCMTQKVSDCKYFGVQIFKLGMPSIFSKQKRLSKIGCDCPFNPNLYFELVLN